MKEQPPFTIILNHYKEKGYNNTPLDDNNTILQNQKTRKQLLISHTPNPKNQHEIDIITLTTATTIDLTNPKSLEQLEHIINKEID